MQYCHECPIDILDEISEYNDYDYALLHLMDIPEYFDYYRNTPKELYLDNSAFEYQFLDTEFDLDYFYSIIEEINPDVVIVPDVLNNSEKSIQNAHNFNYTNHKYMGVLQGETFDELFECYEEYQKIGMDYIAVPFHSVSYQSMFADLNNKALRDAYGRPFFIKQLIKKYQVKENSLHLIGLSLPLELKNYNNEMKYIKSIDTANPVKYGFVNGVYGDIDKIVTKPHYILDHETIQRKTKPEELKNIIQNIKIFQSIN